jgi:hypothetical protein
MSRKASVFSLSKSLKLGISPRRDTRVSLPSCHPTFSHTCGGYIPLMMRQKMQDMVRDLFVSEAGYN